MTADNPASAKSLIQLAAIAALALVAFQAYYFVTMLIDMFSIGSGSQLLRILFNNSPFYISGALFLAGALALLNGRAWGWILLTGSAAFRLLSILFRWIRTLEFDLFDFDSLSDVLYPISFFLFIAILVLMFSPTVRRALSIEVGNIGLAFIVPGILFPMQIMMQFMDGYFRGF